MKYMGIFPDCINGSDERGREREGERESKIAGHIPRQLERQPEHSDRDKQRHTENEGHRQTAIHRKKQRKTEVGGFDKLKRSSKGKAVTERVTEIESSMRHGHGEWAR